MGDQAFKPVAAAGFQTTGRLPARSPPAAMAARIRRISENIGHFRADYERTPAENHRGNIPPEFQPRIDDYYFFFC